MWIAGTVISIILVFLSGVAHGLSQRILFRQDTLPKNMQNSFWLFSGTDTIKAAKYRRFKDFDPAKGPKFWGSTNIFIGLTNGYHLTTALHGILLSAGSMVWAISVFFIAEGMSHFIFIELTLLTGVYFVRCLGKIVIDDYTKRSSGDI
jgi:hypothetical protein